MLNWLQFLKHLRGPIEREIDPRSAEERIEENGKALEEKRRIHRLERAKVVRIRRAVK